MMLEERFERTDSMEDLEKAVEISHRVIGSIPENHPDRAAYLTSLGSRLRIRYERIGDIVDLEEAIQALQQSVNLTLEGHDRTARLNDLANMFSLRYQRKGETRDLEEAIRLARYLVDSTLEDDPNRAAILNNLGNKLASRFERTGEMHDLEDAIRMIQQAVDSTMDDRNRALWLNNLGNNLVRRYERTRNMQDLDDAMKALQQVLDLTPESHQNRAAYLNNLGLAFEKRYKQTAEIQDLEEAVRVTRKAVDSTPEDHPSRVAWLNNFGVLLVNRYEATEEARYLEEAIQVAQKAVDLTPEDHPQRAAWLNNLGNHLSRRYEITGETGMLEAAIRIAQQAVDLTPESQADRAVSLSNLGDMLESRYKRTGEVRDLEESIRMAEQAVHSIPSDHPDLADLSYTLQRRFKVKDERPNTLIYGYKPLDPFKHEIRLLNLLPAASGDVIACSLFHASLDDNPQYAALSYVWGDTKDKHTILLDGTPFTVTRNLEIVLRRMRSRNLTQPLWVDAVCINQNDVVEKGHQIQNMRSIYQKAFAVFGWLGEADADTHLAMRLIEAIGSEEVGVDTALDASATRADIGDISPNEKDDLDSDFWKAVVKLLKRPYWRRGWIVQELAVAQPANILLGCGTYWTPWLFLVTTASKRVRLLRQGQASAILGDTGGGYETTASIVLAFHTKGHLSIGELLRHSRNHHTTEPHDRLYAFLGLMNDRDRSAFPPDYSKPISQLSAELVKHAIEVEGNLDALHMYRTHMHQTPSWVPQITTPMSGEDSWHLLDTEYCASGGTQAVVGFSTDLGTITIRGFTVDTIASCEGPFDSKEVLFTKLLCTQEFQDAALSAMMSQGQPDTFEGMEEIIWRTLVADRAWDLLSLESSSFRDMYRLISSRSQKLAEMDTAGVDINELMKYLAVDVLPYVMGTEAALLGRCFATTRGGRIATAPPATRNGDLLCVLYGGSVVHVLREEEDHYILVGEAYVYDLMNGQAIQAYQSGESELQEQDFTIW
ncbi:hypothetical protein FOPG_18678 [Fusarium oxysporum f. sp. conglutinans race 2 54008]|nr:hypothetical protein FOPG_18678 [Fusarium oxysporum f. sp. conglutinans race 2 54008]